MIPTDIRIMIRDVRQLLKTAEAILANVETAEPVELQADD